MTASSRYFKKKNKPENIDIVFVPGYVFPVSCNQKFKDSELKIMFL